MQQKNIGKNSVTNDYNDNELSIDITVRDDSYFLSSLSDRYVPLIHTEVAEFIENRVTYPMLKHGFSLRIHSDCIDDEEKKIYKKALREYYRNHYQQTKTRIKKEYLLSFLMLITGIVLLGITFFFHYVLDSSFVGEIIDIASWVFLWESVDGFAFKTQELRIARKRYLVILQAKIAYFPLSSDDRNTK